MFVNFEKKKKSKGNLKAQLLQKFGWEDLRLI